MEHREDHNEIPEFTLRIFWRSSALARRPVPTEDLPAEENSPGDCSGRSPCSAGSSRRAGAPHTGNPLRPLLWRSSPGKPEGLRFTPGADPVDMDFPAEVLRRYFPPAARCCRRRTSRPETQIIHFPHQPAAGGGDHCHGSIFGGERPRRRKPAGGAAGNAGTCREAPQSLPWSRS